MEKVKSVNTYLEHNSHFIEELKLLRRLLLSTELDETIKWSAPVFTLNGKNVIGLGAFKNHYCLWFFNGVFLKDKQNLLVNAQEGKTKALRQMRFNKESDLNHPTILAYINEAIKNEKAGKKLTPAKKDITLEIPDLLLQVLSQNKALNSAFKKLSLSKQKEYCNYINDAKREATKLSRTEKIIPLILSGSGLNDKYKNC